MGLLQRRCLLRFLVLRRRVIEDYRLRRLSKGERVWLEEGRKFFNMSFPDRVIFSLRYLVSL